MVSSSSSSRTVSEESSTNGPPNTELTLELPMAQNHQANRSQNKATSGLRRPQSSPNHIQPGYMYSCTLCPEKFPTYQALGGHQNAHRKERLFQKCFVMMERNGKTPENNNGGGIKVANNIHDHHNHHQNPTINVNSSSSDVVLSPDPIRVAYPVSEFQRVVVPYHPNLPLGFKTGQKPTLDGSSPATFLSHLRPPPPPPSSATTFAPPQPGGGGLPPLHRTYSSLQAPIPRPPMNDLGGGSLPQPSFPPGFGTHVEHGGGSSEAAMRADRKGRAVAVEDVLMVKEEEEEEGKHSWGRDLKLWP